MHKTMVSIVSLEKIEMIRSQEFMVSIARLKFLKRMIILGPKTAILGPQFCTMLVLGPHFWWSGGPGPPGSAPELHQIQMILLCYGSIFCHYSNLIDKSISPKSCKMTLSFIDVLVRIETI